MMNRIDLGRTTLYATVSHLRLEFSATASFTRHKDHEPHVSIQQEALKLYWITEAPELELCFFIRIPTGVDIKPTFVQSLERKICNSKVWPELGFDIILKESPDRATLPCSTEEPSLRFGLCRRNQKTRPENSQNVPAILKNPPEPHPPPDLPVLSMSSVDMTLKLTQCRCANSLQEGYSAKHVSRDHIFPQPQTFSTTKYQNPTDGIAGFAATCPNLNCRTQGIMTATNHYSQHYCQLVAFGLQRLIFSGKVKTPQVVVEEDTLQSLSGLVPAIFNPSYREAMHQRAFSIQLVTNSINNMLKANHAISLRSKMPENTIQSSLWTLAQNKIPKGKTMKKETTFFEHTHIAEVSQLLFDPYTTSIDHLTDTDILDSGDEISPAVNNHAALSNLEDHEWFSEESSMISFEDLEESTDTTQTTSYDDSAVDECFAPKLTDIEMLLSDSGSMEDCLDESDGFVAIEI